MRLGDTNVFAVDLDPVAPGWERRSAADRGPWARFAIWVNGRNLASNVLPGTAIVREGVFVPLAPLADWLVRNAKFLAYEESARAFPTDALIHRAVTHWADAPPAAGYQAEQWDDERFDWAERHLLVAGAEGAWIPDVAFVRSDDRLWVSWAEPRFATERAPVFLERENFDSVPWSFAAHTLGAFVDWTAAALRELGLVDAYPWAGEDGAFYRALDLTWSDFSQAALGLPEAEVLRLFHVANPAALRERLGLPPDATPFDSIALQSLRDLHADDDVLGDVLARCETTTRTTGTGQLKRGRAIARDAAAAGRTPEDQGYEAARALRHELGVNGHPLAAPIAIAKGFDVAVEDAAGPSNDYAVAGARLDGSGALFLLSSKRLKAPWARSMEILRGLGHLLLDAGTQGGVIGAGSSSRATGPRRRRSGTFAAEMLLPRDAMIARSGGMLDAAAAPEVFESLLADYGVGAYTAAWQLWNAKLLSSKEIREDLVARYAHK